MHIKTRDSMGDDTGFMKIEKKKIPREYKKGKGKICPVREWMKKSNVLEEQFLSTLATLKKKKKMLDN
jgi:hypothetical protein